MKGFFTTILFQPILNALMWIYGVIPGHDIGLAIIVLTIVIRFVLWPFQQSALKSQKALQTIQPKLKALQEQYKDDKTALNKAMVDLYAREKVSPFSSCLPLLIQLPFLIALYQVLGSVLKSSDFNLLYSFVPNPGAVNQVAFGFLNLANRSIILSVLAGLAQFAQTKMMPTSAAPPAAGAGAKDENKLANINKQMLYIMPAFTVFIGISLPGGLTLYWLMTTLFAIFQQWLFLRGHKRKASETLTTNN